MSEVFGVSLTQEWGTSSGPAKVEITHGEEVVCVIAEIVLRMGADGGYYPTVFLRKEG